MSRIRLTVADEPFLIVRCSVADARAGSEIADHVHDWHQLTSISAGLMRVSTPAGAWIAPPGFAVWAPAGARHAIRFIGASAFRALYFRPEAWPAPPDRCTAMLVTPLLRELIGKVGALGALDRRRDFDLAIATVMREELRPSDARSFTLPEPRTDLTRRVSELIAVGDHAEATTAAIARALGVGARTLERRFAQDMGMSLGLWRRHRDLFEALEPLARGASIKAVADKAGYATPSAFVAAFKSVFGATPGRYFPEPRQT